MSYKFAGKFVEVDESFTISDPETPDPEASPGTNLFTNNSKWLGDGLTIPGWTISGTGTVTPVTGDNDDRYLRFQTTGDSYIQIETDVTVTAGLPYTLSFQCFGDTDVTAGDRVMAQAVPYGPAGNTEGRPLVEDMVDETRFGWTFVPSETRAFAFRLGPGAGSGTSADVIIGEPMLDQSDKLREYDPTDPVEAPPDPDPEDPVGGDTPTNGWSVHSSSNIGWLPEGFDASDFTQSRWPSGAPANRMRTSTPASSMGPAVTRLLVQGEPVYLLERFPTDEIIIPATVGGQPTGGVCIEWYQYFDDDFWTGAGGKRFGISSQYGAGGGRVPATVDDYGNTTIGGVGGYGNDGGWSWRYFPRRSSNSDLTGKLRYHSIYAYPQNRGVDFNAPGGGSSRLFGATFNGPSLTHANEINRPVRMNVTWIANTDGNKDGRLVLWKDGILQFNQGGIMWQRNMSSYPPYRFWWAWMHGGTESASNQIPFGSVSGAPSSAETEYYNRFRCLITTRAGAIANPWPFAAVLAAALFLNPFSAESAYHRPIGDGATYASDAHPSRAAWEAVVPANNGQDGGGTALAPNTALIA